MEVSIKNTKNVIGLTTSFIGVSFTFIGEILMTAGYSKTVYLTCSAFGILLALCGVIMMTLVLAKK